VEECGGGGPDLEAQYRRLQPALLRRLRRSQAWQAEDLAADVWTEVLTLLPRFEGDENAFRAWVFTLARRRLIDSYRRAGRRPTEPLAVNGNRDGNGDGIGDGMEMARERPEDDAVARMSIEALVVRLHQVLPPDQAEIVLLRLIAGLPVDQVADLTGKQPVNVRVLQHRALRRLASRLGPSQQSA
jgi:RNA polymerase sigma-70 factor (ECF subfamily)